MKSLFLLSSLVLFSASLCANEAIRISTEFEQAKIEALESYLKDNPEAQDRDIGLRILVGSYTELGEYAAVPDLLRQRYEAIPESEEVNFPLLFGEIVRPLVEASISSGQKDKAKAFLTRVKSDYAGRPEEPQIIQLLDQIGADLYLPGVGDEIEFAFTDLKGNEIDLALMKDKVILVDFWATWCAPCLAMLPELKEVYSTYRDEGFEVIGISLDESRKELSEFVALHKIEWPHYCDALGSENEIAQRYGIRQIPTTFLVGKGGRIIAADLRGEELVSAIEAEITKEP
ncbi:MAG: TlpA disulfide reductase family protein [Verrucomicrobiota bacterium]